MNAIKKIIVVLLAVSVGGMSAGQLVLGNDRAINSKLMKKRQISGAFIGAAVGAIASAICCGVKRSRDQEFGLNDAAFIASLIGLPAIGGAIIGRGTASAPSNFRDRYKSVHADLAAINCDEITTAFKDGKVIAFFDDAFPSGSTPLHDGEKYCEKLIRKFNQVSDRICQLQRELPENNPLATKYLLGFDPLVRLPIIPSKVSIVKDAWKMLSDLRLCNTARRGKIVEIVRLIKKHSRYAQETRTIVQEEKEARAEFERREEWRLKQETLKAKQDLVREQIRLRKDEVRVIARQEVDKVTGEVVERKTRQMRSELRDLIYDRIRAELADIRSKIDRMGRNQQHSNLATQITSLTSRITALQTQVNNIPAVQAPPSYNQAVGPPPVYQPYEPSAPPYDGE